jgi:pimeloyl-ACP methyl ester carboxylesterase
VEHVDIEGLRIAYERAGEGPPIALLHGYVGDGPTTWRRQIDALSDDFTVVAWDAPGAGSSSDPPEHFGMAAYADCLAAFLRTIGVPRANVVGLSFGGALALALYGSHRAIPTSLVLVSAYAGWAGSLPADAAQHRLHNSLRLSERSPNDFVDALLPTMFSAAVAPEDVAAFGASMRAFHPAGFRAMARASYEDLRAVLATVDVPTMLIYGDRDERAPLYVAEHLRAAIPAAELVVLPGVGHVCNVEAPDRFDDDVRRFLPRTAADSRSSTGDRSIVMLSLWHGTDAGEHHGRRSTPGARSRRA